MLILFTPSAGIQTTGGVVDFYVFSGPTPADVIKQYLEVCLLLVRYARCVKLLLVHVFHDNMLVCTRSLSMRQLIFNRCFS